MKDAIEGAFPDLPPDATARLREVFAEEMEAACQQMRIGGAVVVQQVERKSRQLTPGQGLALILAVLLAVAGIFAALGTGDFFNAWPAAVGFFVYWVFAR
jgi:hypothetical protein